VQNTADECVAVSGGILGLYVAGLNASVSAAVGFISLFGVSAMDGILLVSYIRREVEEGRGSENAIIYAGEARMRQIFMTGFSACIGLVPAAVSTGIGSQIQRLCSRRRAVQGSRRGGAALDLVFIGWQ
jgi:heavy metal efflux system protein